MKAISHLLAALLFAAAAVISVSDVHAQADRIPLTSLSLQDLGSFAPTGQNWSIVGGVSARLGGDVTLQTSPGTGVLVNSGTAGVGENLFTAWEHGDLELELDYMMPRESNSGIYLQGRYEVQLFDSWGQERPTFTDAGGIYQRWDESRGAGNEGYEGIAPLANPQKAPGLWNHLRIIFQAPRFDEAGGKTRDATFLLVEHNGVVVQENVKVTGPTRATAFDDEQPLGPLMIQGDHGPVAFRNIRFRRYGQDQIALSNVRYEVREGTFKSLEYFAGAAVLRTGASDGFNWQASELEDKFAITFRGDMEVPSTGTYLFGLNLDWIDDDPHFTGAIRGGGVLTVDGEQVFIHTGSERGSAGTIDLKAGTHPFTLTYFKNRSWADPVAEFYAEGSSVPYHALNAPGTLPDPPSYAPVTVAPEDAPLIQRSFVWHQGVKRMNAMNVGDPVGVNYAYDMDTGAPLYVWKGGFIDATPMWHSRGNDQVAFPLGNTVSLSGAPSLAILSNADAQWPASTGTEGLDYQAYRLDDLGHPVFQYAVGDATLHDRLIPASPYGGKGLTRSIEVKGGHGLWLRLAEGASITRRNDGLYDIDGQYYLRLDEAGGNQPILRTSGNRQELLLPLGSTEAAETLSYTLIW